MATSDPPAPEPGPSVEPSGKSLRARPPEQLEQFVALGGHGGAEHLAEMVPTGFGPPGPPHDPSREEAFLRLIRFNGETRESYFAHQQNFSLDAELSRSDAPRRINHLLLARISTAYRAFKYSAGSLGATDHDTTLIRGVSDALLAIGIAYRRQDKVFLNQLLNQCTAYLVSAGVRSTARSNAVRLFHGTVLKLVIAHQRDWSQEEEERLRRAYSLARLALIVLKTKDKLEPLRRDIQPNGGAVVVDLEATADELRPLVLDAIEDMPRKPSDMEFEKATRAIVRGVLRKVGMPRDRANALYDFDRNARSKKTRRTDVAPDDTIGSSSSDDDQSD